MIIFLWDNNNCHRICLPSDSTHYEMGENTESPETL